MARTQPEFPTTMVLNDSALTINGTNCAQIADVLTTPELLEQILLGLDIRTLLVSAQRVCSKWHSMITESPSLQCALFFRADLSLSPSSRQVNTLLKEVFPPWFEINSYWTTGGKDIISKSDVLVPQAHRVFQDLPLYQASLSIGVENNPFFLAQASWKRMLVTQPPIRQIHIYDEVIQMLGISSELTVKHYPLGTIPCIDRHVQVDQAGLRMGEFYDIAMRNLSACQTKTLCASWSGDQIPGLGFRQHPLCTLTKKETLNQGVNEGYEVILAFCWIPGCQVRPMTKEDILFWRRCGMNVQRKRSLLN
jgi:hypothetical protein